MVIGCIIVAVLLRFVVLLILEYHTRREKSSNLQAQSNEGSTELSEVE